MINSRINLPQLYPNAFTVTKEPTGFPTRDETTITQAVTNNREFTITGTNFSIYIKGKRLLKNTQTITVPDLTQLNYIYYDNTGTLKTSTTFWDLSETVPVATVKYNTALSEGRVGDERHGISWPWSVHEYVHLTIGSRYFSGFASTYNDTGFSLASGIFFDEDIMHSVGAQTQTRVFYKDGSSEFKWTSKQNAYFYSSGGNLYYNSGNTLTPASSNYYIAMWGFITNDPETPFIHIMGQRQDINLSSARTNNTYESLSLGNLPFAEYKVLYRIILRNDATPYEEIQDLRSLVSPPSSTYVATLHSSLTGLTNPDHPASAITVDTTEFDGILSSADDTVLKALKTIDDTSALDGKSAYEIAVENGFEGTEAEWLLSLKGADGAKGDKGDTGERGLQGEQGLQGVAGQNGTNGADGQDGYTVTVRQTVLSGRKDASGYANFIEVGTGLNVVMKASSTDKLIMTGASGFDSNGYALDNLSVKDSDTTLSSLTASKTLYIYYDFDTSTFGFTEQQPDYQYVTSGTTTDKHIFVIPEMKLYRYTGSSWETKNRVFIGECVTSTDSVTSVITYALNGMWDSGWFSVSPNNNYTKYHYLGFKITGHCTVEHFASMDSSGADSIPWVGFHVSSTNTIGQYSRENLTPTTINYYRFGFGSVVSYIRGANRTTNCFWRIFIKRGW